MLICVIIYIVSILYWWIIDCIPRLWTILPCAIWFIYREIQLGNRQFYETAAYCKDSIDKTTLACGKMLEARFRFPINVSALSKVRQMFE